LKTAETKYGQVCDYNDGQLATAGHFYFAVIFSRQDKIKIGLTQRREERRERLLMGKFYRLFLTLRSLRLK